MRDDAGRATEVTVIAGAARRRRSRSRRRRDSWAARADSGRRDLDDQAGAGRALDAAGRARAGANRTLYFFRGGALRVGDARMTHARAIALRADAEVALENGADEGELLLLQGRPIGEPVVQHGPFVMNTRARDPAGDRPTTSARSSAAGRGRATSPCTAASKGGSRATPTGMSSTPARHQARRVQLDGMREARDMQDAWTTYLQR